MVSYHRTGKRKSILLISAKRRFCPARRNKIHIIRIEGGEADPCRGMQEDAAT
jgi:hypothetical protein